MVEKTDARIEKSRAALLGTGLTLLLEKPNASFSEIADQAGVGRTTLYRQFKTREQLIQAIARRCLEQIDRGATEQASRAKSYREAIELILLSVMPLADRLRFLALFWDIAVQDDDIVERNARYNREMVELIEAAKREGSIEPTLPSDWVADLIDSLFQVAWKLIDVNGYSERDAAEMVIKTLFDGISPEV